MYEINDIIILTLKEYEEYERKARIICSQRENRESINMRLRFPYYIPTPEDVEKHKKIPLSDIIPYYIYLMVKDENDVFLVEPDDELLNETRDYMRMIYEPRIFIVNSTSEEKALIKKIKRKI